MATALEAEIAKIEANIAAAVTKYIEALDAKDAERCNNEIEHTDALEPALTKRADDIAAQTQTQRRAALDAEIAAAKTKRNIKLAAMDAEIAALELELAAHRS